MSNLPMIKTGADGANDIIQLVSFELGREEYGVDVLSVREIIRLPAITKMPNTPDYVDGIINLRGAVIPIISLRRRFGLMDSEVNRNSRILVMETAGGLHGFAVDAVAEVIRISSSEIQPAPSITRGSAAQECITGVVNRSEHLLVVLDLNQLFTSEEQAQLEGLG
ncbi:chemotaxis protein CheW [Geobacter sp. AOG2]|uniref:chemotaxis protein CheW n=1 Tax=Geobacter sp. AOG2 TaxID=1566347 RepID=UPI001CC380C6|nr:chemotaxis protein CheW [Geobacter sp. AOG2]GFE61691.1 chemotaxis protein CheW [Geobacter sp. AOG2]